LLFYFSYSVSSSYFAQSQPVTAVLLEYLEAQVCTTVPSPHPLYF
jgi:hypothetical protein